MFYVPSSNGVFCREANRRADHKNFTGGCATSPGALGMTTHSHRLLRLLEVYKDYLKNIYIYIHYVFTYMYIYILCILYILHIHVHICTL